MKLTFETNLEYQRDVSYAVVGLFERQLKACSVSKFDLDEIRSGKKFSAAMLTSMPYQASNIVSLTV